MKKIFIYLLAFIALPSLLKAQGCEEPSGEGVNVFGFFQPKYEYNFLEEDDTNSFGFNRARLGVMGNIPYDFSYYMVIETSPFKDGEAVHLLDAFVTYNRFDFAKMTMGAFKTPISLEWNTACHKLHTINRSKVVSQLVVPDRDMGFMVFGGADSTLFKYAVSVTNGTGLLQHDTNSSKDYSARVVMNINEHIKLGASGKYGECKNETEGMPDDERTRYGADVEMSYGNFLVQGEYLYGKDVGSYTTGGGCGEEVVMNQGSIKRDGMFLMAMYKTESNFQPVLKFEYFDPNKDMDDDHEYITTLGLNYFFNDWTKVQLNYVYAAEKGTEIDNDQVMLQFTVKF